MNLIETFQNLVAQVPELVQPLIVALAGAVPFIEGEGAATIGIIGGIHPVIAAVAAIAGNFLCVLVLVLLSSGARNAVVTRNQERKARLAAADGTAGGVTVVEAEVDGESSRSAARKAKFRNALDRYGVPGVSLLGPLLLPTQFTATMLAATGVSKARVLFWQAIAIIGWTTILSVFIGSVVHAVS
ncbi:small multidrug efflux protein [Microbacterium murale]|uniref:Membrane protein n=1 Tax=Microbacterium murale TaxID=1081040 RepID=A0ABU0P8C9_9MICO|nr:small multidrug efflux protein [Microbacterium murale]MDQ0643588.1 putative membrane protein [Microbacterium murale]